jgi:hypothetical protein
MVGGSLGCIVVLLHRLGVAIAVVYAVIVSFVVGIGDDASSSNDKAADRINRLMALSVETLGLGWPQTTGVSISTSSVVDMTPGQPIPRVSTSSVFAAGVSTSSAAVVVGIGNASSSNDNAAERINRLMALSVETLGLG